MKRPPYSFEEGELSGELVEDEGKGVIRKCCGASFPVFFQHLDLINRYCMI
jgi:hypothetical protein